jgi:hypothetical protein
VKEFLFIVLSISELLLGGQLLLDGLSVELHQLAGVLGHQLVDDGHLLGGERTALLKLVGEGGEDDGVHAAEAHAVVVGDVGCTLLVGSLIAEDGEERALGPAGVGREFVLQCVEGVGFIHHTYIISEP